MAYSNKYLFMGANWMCVLRPIDASGLCDAAGYVLGIFAARRLTGFLITLLPQVRCYTEEQRGDLTGLCAVDHSDHHGSNSHNAQNAIQHVAGLSAFVLAIPDRAQILGALLIIVGEVTSLIPSFASGTNLNVVWIGFFILSIVPSAVSFVLKESVFVEHVRDALHERSHVSVAHDGHLCRQ